MAWPVNARTSAMMDEAQALYGATITATQGSPNIGVGASAGTHDGEGVIDVTGADLDLIVIAMRMVGFAAWHRTPAQGFVPHVHGVAVGEPLLSPAAASQVAAYFAGLNGLASNAADDGPRTWVGVTWETYSGGAPLDPGPVRPVGHPFWGESRPPEDWSVLSGSANFVDADGTVRAAAPSAGGAAQTWGEGDRREGDGYTHVDSAAKLLWIFSSTPTYLKTVDVVTVSWIVRARGNGTLTVSNDWDTSWAYTDPAVTLDTVDVDSSPWVELEFPTTTYSVADLLDAAGGYRMAVDVTGTVDIDVVQLRIWPPDGPPGGFSAADPTSDQQVEADSGGRFIAIGYSDYLLDGVSPPPATWDDGWSQAVANLGDFNATSGLIGVSDSSVSKLWTLNIAATPIDVFADLFAPAPDGVENTDYIRRPDRTYLDALAYIQFAAGDPQITAWLNNSVSLHTDIDDFGVDFVVEKLPWQPFDLSGPTVVDTPLVGTTLVSGPVGSPGTYGLGLGLDDSALTLTLRDALWASAGADLGNGPLFEQFQIYLGVADFAEDPSTWLPLTATVALPDHQAWHPGWWQGPDDPDVPADLVTWLRQRQRNDGLGNSVIRAKGSSSRQRSLRQRGYR